jgi:hypothetical protein
MRDAEKQRFREGMEFLRERYGLFVRQEEDEWKRKLASYWEQLRKFDWVDVQPALIRASEAEYYPDRFPTAGQLERVISAVQLERKTTERTRTVTELDASDDERAWERYHGTPSHPDAQAEYVAAAPSPAQRLAREWECESRRLELDPTKRAPRDIERRRLTELTEIVGSFGAWPE